MDRQIIFTDENRQELFRIPDDSCIEVISFDGSKTTYPCKYVSETEIKIGGCIYESGDFAREQAEKGAVFAPSDRRPEDIGIYEIYQIRDTHNTDYSFCSFDQTQEIINPLDYTRVYAAMLSPNQSLNELYIRHNDDARPFGRQMRSLSVSDVVVLLKGSKVEAYYVDTFGFALVPTFFEPEALPVSQRNVISGYTITSSIPVKNKVFTLAENPNTVQPFVTWQGQKDSEHMDWGHYFKRRVDAVRDLYRRVNSERDSQPFARERLKHRDFER